MVSAIEDFGISNLKLKVILVSFISYFYSSSLVSLLHIMC